MPIGSQRISATATGAVEEERDLLANLPDESPEPRATSLFTIIDHRGSAPLVSPPPAPAQQRHRSSRLKRLGRGESLAIAGVILAYAIVVGMTFAFGIANRQAQRKADAVAAETGFDVPEPAAESSAK
jgi:hypothetical protein